MANIVIINPRFEISFWRLEHCMPLFGKRANLPVANLALLAALVPKHHQVTRVGYARVSSTGQDLGVQLDKLNGCDKIFKEKCSGVDAGRPELKRCLEYLREGDILLVSKIDRLARSTSDLYRIVSLLAEKGISFKVIDDPSIDTSSRTGKLVMGILGLISGVRE
jgi:predicted site-specific integrase-resolvase